MTLDDGKIIGASCGVQADGTAPRRGESEVRARGSCGVDAAQQSNKSPQELSSAWTLHHSILQPEIFTY